MMCPVLRALKSAAAQRAARGATKERRTFDEELRDRDEAEDVHLEHALVVRVRDLADALDAEHFREHGWNSALNARAILAFWEEMVPGIFDEAAG